MSRIPQGRNLQLPTVTVIGAGIAGLTTAHELIERGFPVQIVESAEDEFVEYACAVGGLAANQFARARLAIQDLHPWLLDDKEKHNLERVERYRSVILDQTARRFPIKETLRFDKRTHGPGGPAKGNPPRYDEVKRTKCEPPGPIPADWRNYWDRHGVYNYNKFNRVFEAIRDATAFYTALYLPDLWQRLAYGPEMKFPADWIGGKVLTQLAWPSEDAKRDAEHAKLAQRFAARETFVIQIIGYTDGDGTAEANRATAFDWAHQIRTALIDFNNSLEPDKQIFNLGDRLEIKVVGDQDPVYDQKDALGRNLSNRVEFAIVEQVLPGEHGFRFFPAFYRNLFDTMRRTPIFDEKGKVVCTAFDQLNATPHPAIAAGLGGQPKDVAAGISSLWQSNELLKLLRNDLRFQLSDLFGLEYYILRFLTSCSARREKEAEPINLLQYIGGQHPSRRFSKAALDFLTHAPRALAAMSATESDARTQLDVTAQLLSVNSIGQLPEHMTLNGPTSKAWLDHWKAYLKNQGVEFFVGRISSLEAIKDRYVPVWQTIDGCRKIIVPVPEDPEHCFKAPSKDGSDIEQHRFVLALSYQKATDLLWNYADHVMSADSAFRQLLEFDVHVGRRKTGNKGLIPVHRDPLTGAEPADYPLRTISGAQMFFPGNYRFGEGNVYFARTSWDLTSISQLSYWKDGDPLGEFRGQISVDVGAWHEFAPRRGVKAAKEDHGNVAWYSSADEIAAEVWAEVLSGFETRFGEVVQAPRCFHLDRNLVFSEAHKIKTCRSALIRVVLLDADFDGNIKQLLSVDVHSTPGSNVRSPGRPAELAVGAMTLSKIIASLINKAWPSVQAFGLASSDDDKVPQDVLISPRALGRNFVVEFNSISKNLFFLSCGRPDQEVVVHEFSISDDRSARGPALRERLPAEIDILPLDNNNRAFLLRASVDMVLWVSNADGAIEIANGPVQQIAVMSHALRFFCGRIGGVGIAASGAVRANALVMIGTADKNVVNPFVPLRDYWLAIGVGVGEPLHVKSESGHTAAVDVRDHFFDWLTTTEVKRLVIAQKVDNATGHGIVISPVTVQRSALIRVLPAWSTPDAPNFSDDPAQRGTFTIRIGGDDIVVSGVGLTVTQIRDTIIEKLEAAHKHTIVLEAVGEDSLLVTRAPGRNPTLHLTLSLGALNADARIEVVGAPALIIKTRRLFLEAPPQGFVVMRNDAEFLINIYDQWRLRPGLRRDPSDIPKHYRQLSADFGDKDTEIYYGTSRECRLLEHWTPAGTYMATYTRITTMEAANESGRHAAAAILYKLLASKQKNLSGQPIGLVGNFPMIWRIEDYELDDLRFAKDLDSGLVAANLPHALDILGVTELVNSILASSVNDRPLLTEALGLIRAALGQPQQATMATLKTLADRLIVLTKLKGFSG